MYLQHKIEEALWAIKPQLEANSSFYTQHRYFTRALKPWDVKVNIAVNLPYAVRGLYNPNPGYTRLQIIIERPTVKDQFDNIPQLLFDLNCTVQHEMIHHYQWTHRDVKLFSPKRYCNEGATPTQRYLSDLDEIEAQAHDLAMEIRYFYPNVEPRVVLNKYFDTGVINLPTLLSYMNAFDHQVSHPAVRRLLCKLFIWLPRVEIRRPITCLGE